MAKDIPSWAAALGKVPSGLFILTVKAEQGETGMLASWVQQCSFEPPQLTIAIDKERYFLDWLTTDTPLTVNVLSSENKKLTAHFGKGFGPDEPAFEGLNVDRPDGEAVILNDALAAIHGRFVAKHDDGGDHMIVVARVTDGVILNDAVPSVQIRNSATHY